MKRMVSGIILVAGGLILALLGFSGAVIIGEFTLMVLGTILFGLGFRH